MEAGEGLVKCTYQLGLKSDWAQIEAERRTFKAVGEEEDGQALSLHCIDIGRLEHSRAGGGQETGGLDGGGARRGDGVYGSSSVHEEKSGEGTTGGGDAKVEFKAAAAEEAGQPR